MKQLVITLLAASGLAFPASATLFQGIITGTVVDPVVNPFFGLNAPGDSFTGTYSYESPTVDGVFTPASGNLQVSFTFPDSTVLTQSDAANFPIGPALGVTGGSVGGMDIGIFSKPGTPVLGTFIFQWVAAASIASLDDDPITGTFVFSKPTAVSTSVPDAGSTLPLLALGLLGFPFCRRWVK